ncbi:MAG: putative fimbrial chaperone YadV [Pseudomonas sp.]|nr:MAG: putative fimbrial chaperone YadV [Pseudomonas sp.]
MKRSYCKRWPLAFWLFWVMLWPACSEAALSVVGTRFIYPSDGQPLSIHIANRGDQPILVQGWLDRGDMQVAPSDIQVPFVLAPPLLRLDPREKHALQLRYTGEFLPADRESLFWINLLEVSAQENRSGNRLHLNYRLRMKLLFRPQGLRGQPEAAVHQVIWRLLQAPAAGHSLRVEASNPSAFYVSLSSLALEDAKRGIPLRATTLPPFARTLFELPPDSGFPTSMRVHYQAVGDSGQLLEGSASLQAESGHPSAPLVRDVRVAMKDFLACCRAPQMVCRVFL